MIDILNKITESIKDYENGEWQLDKLIKIRKDLSVNLYFLSVENGYAFQRWNTIIYNSKDSVARATVEANEKVPELRMSRKIIETGRGVNIALSSDINALLKEIITIKQ
jgi:hypothetical protein